MPAAGSDSNIGMPLYPDMKDKVAVVTGGTSGIGLATALSRQITSTASAGAR